MPMPTPGFLRSFLVSSVLFLSAASFLFASSREDSRDVRLGTVEGDVRLSRGNHERPDLKQPWEEAQPNENISQGFALATGNGRASIDFEDGSTIYLAENSLLLLNNLSTNQKGSATSVSLISGSATFELKPQAGNRFSIKTPSDNLFVDPPEDFHARIDAYLDATAITPQGEHGESLNRAGQDPVHFKRGESFYLNQGHIVETRTDSSVDPQQFAQRVAAFCSRSMFDQFPQERLLELCDSLQRRPLAVSSEPTATKLVAPDSRTNLTSQVSSDWDKWVSDRVREKSSLTSAALEAAGLSSPVPELTELYQHGTFFECAPYGTCWEPEGSESVQQGATMQLAQNPSPASASNQTFPTTVEIYEPHYGICGLDGWFPKTHVANTPEDLRRLLVLQQQAERERSRHSTFFDSACFDHAYVFHRNRYARLVSPSGRPVCGPHDRCKKHPPFPHSITAVRVNGKLGFVPRHPDDKKGKPPVNLKNGVLFLPEKPGQPIHRVTFDSSQKLKVESRIPAELDRELAPRAPAAPAPEIHAHLMNELFRGSTVLSASSTSSTPRITFDYKSQKFLMSALSTGEKNEKPVPVGGLSGGRMSGFAGSYSNHSLPGFERSGNSSGRGSSDSGGGHYSGSVSASSGSHSGGSGSSGSSHSYGGGSSGASSGGGSHYSGGASSSSSSSSSGSSSGSSNGSSSGGGRPH